MNKLALIAFVIFFSYSSFSQVPTSADYLTKSRHQRTAAWIMLGGGVALTTLGVAATAVSTLDYAAGGSTNNNIAGSALAVAGISSLLGSIPMFIFAAHNRQKAMKLSFNMQQISPPSAILVRTVIWQPAVTLKVPF